MATDETINDWRLTIGDKSTSFRREAEEPKTNNNKKTMNKQAKITYHWQLIASTILAAFFFVNTTANTPPLLDRELFFGDPEISGGQLSPNGEYLSFMRPLEGTRNIWIKPREAAFADAMPVTNRTDRPIPGYFWSRDGKFILFVMDQGGDENFNIYALNPAETSPGVIPEARNITEMEGVRAAIYHIAHHDPDIIYVGLNDRDAAWHDLYQLQISTGELTLLRENTNRFTSWTFDWDDNLRLASRSKENGDNELWRMDADGSETLIYEWGMMETAYAAGFDKSNENIYLVSDKGVDRDKSKLFLMNLNTLEKTFLEKDPENRVDFGGIWQSEKTREIIATIYLDDKVRIHFQNEEYERHYNHLKEQLGNSEISFSSSTNDEKLMMVLAYSDIKPSSVYLYDMDNMALTYQYSPRTGLPEEYLSPMLPIRYISSDGLEIPAYLTLPNGFGEENLPLVIVPHGGPWARDRWGFDTYAQFLANRGYAVLQPNFRGSTGYGKAFVNAGNKEWGDLMQDDITWGIKHLVDQGIVDPERVAIFGISYGGYATLAGLAFTPDLYAAGVSFVGPSNLITLLNSIPPYWEAIRQTFHERMGDPNTPEGEAQLIRQSPLFSADQIVAPLLVVQGQNDPRVLKAESDQIVVALRDRGFPVEYINAPDEGHGFARPENNMAFVAAMEKFLATHVGGRYQEDMPENIAKRLEEITVDINTVTLPEELTGEDMKMQLLPARELVTGEYNYKISIEAFGMELQSKVQISREGDHYTINETTTTPMGQAVDIMTLDAAGLTPMSRSVTQEPLNITLNYYADRLEGEIDMGGQRTPVDIALNGPLFAEGPAQVHLLATLPLHDGYKAVFRNADINSMSEKMFRLSAKTDITDDGIKAWLVEVTAADGSPGTLSIWLDQNSHEVLRFEQVSPEMGGAKMVVVPVQ
jgi:dipeptidyl aminopeptidase/acylaminoacyl peptidase